MSEPIRYCGVNRVALVGRDMAETVEFHQGVLEMPLVKTIDLPDWRGQHLARPCGPRDVRHAPLDRKGERVALKTPAMA
jgi:catechol 2,3-dioxygenase-like lactoylglutathione lyase family enzyme